MHIIHVGGVGDGPLMRRSLLYIYDLAARNPGDNITSICGIIVIIIIIGDVVRTRCWSRVDTLAKATADNLFIKRDVTSIIIAHPCRLIETFGGIDSRTWYVDGICGNWASVCACVGCGRDWP